MTMPTDLQKPCKYAVCVDNTDYPASLEMHKIYRVLPDEDAATDGDIRVIDESGEDYLFSADRFVPIDIPEAVQRSFALMSAKTAEQGCIPKI